MKRLISLALCLSLCITSLIIPASATTEATVDHDLLTRGYPQTLIDLMSYDAKYDIYIAQDLTYSDASYTVFDENTGNYDSYSLMQLENARASGPIPTKDLTILLVASYSLSKKKVLVQLNYEWHKDPFFAYQDPISVSWDSSVCSLDLNSFYKVDKYDSDVVDVNGMHHYTYGGVHSESDTYVEKNTKGVLWFADIKTWVFTYLTALYGYGKFELNCTSDPRGTNVHYRYVHMQGANDGTVSLGSDGVVDVDGGMYQDVSNFVEIK